MLGHDSIVVVPAYGRDYKSKDAALADWTADKDFREAISSRYVNKTGARELGLTVTIRYDGNRRAFVAPTAVEPGEAPAPVTKKVNSKKLRRPLPPLLGLMGRTSA